MATGVWTADMVSAPHTIVAANIWAIVARTMPDAVVADRSAAADGRVSDGIVTVATNRRSTPLTLPGVTVIARPLVRASDDLPWSHGLTMSSPARTLADNLAVSRASKRRAAPTLAPAELQDWLARKAVTWGPQQLENVRAQAIAVADELGHPERAAQVDELVAEVSGVRPLRAHSGAFIRAAVAGRAWDERRVSLFEQLATQLTERGDDEPEWLAPPAVDGELPFFEAYFSNYIEGTQFSIDDAREIVETQTAPAMRNADGHDILGTHRCVIDPVGRASTSDDVDELLSLMRARHNTLLGGRPDMAPGEWKAQNNRVGQHEFVDHALVEGTLRRGFAGRATVPPGFGRAVYMMYVVSEVHPFLDGNGRVARLMMNAELSAVGAVRIVVPTVLSDEYLSALRRLSTHGDADALRKVVAFAWRWTAAMPWTDAAATAGKLVATNALLDSTEAADSSRRLELP